jgi:microbial collagenase
VRVRKTIAQNVAWDGGGHMSLDEVFSATYGSGFRFYSYACAFFNFMRRHPESMTDLLVHVMAEDGAAFDAQLDAWRGDATLAADFEAFLTDLAASADSKKNPRVSDAYLEVPPPRELSRIAADVASAAGLTGATTSRRRSGAFDVVEVRGTHTGGRAQDPVSDGVAMEAHARAASKRLYALGWSGYHTVTAYFIDRRVDAAGRAVYTFVFTLKAPPSE